MKLLVNEVGAAQERARWAWQENLSADGARQTVAHLIGGPCLQNKNGVGIAVLNDARMQDEGSNKEYSVDSRARARY